MLVSFQKTPDPFKYVKFNICALLVIVSVIAYFFVFQHVPVIISELANGRFVNVPSGVL